MTRKTQYTYEVIADRIEADIRSGRLRTGAQLPSYPDMAQEHGVAGNTARRAVRELVERGLVETLPAKGTYVIWEPED